MATNALPPHTVIQELAALTISVSSSVSRFFDREHRVNAFLEPRPLQTMQPESQLPLLLQEAVQPGWRPHRPRLSSFWPRPTPRATDTSGDRVDLAVNDVVLTTDGTAPPQATPSHRLSKLVREGKGGTAGDSLDSIKGPIATLSTRLRRRPYYALLGHCRQGRESHLLHMERRQHNAAGQNECRNPGEIRLHLARHYQSQDV
jgi:hypothetical protein